jgi:ketosteroid isomerase-like protein
LCVSAASGTLRQMSEGDLRMPSSGNWMDYWYENVWAEDVEYRAIEGAIDDHGPIVGRDALREYATDWFDTIDGLELTPEEVIDAGEGTYVAVLRLTGKARGSEVPVQQHLSVIWTFRDGKLVRGREYRTREEAMRAAGLPVSDE